MSNSGLQISP